MSSLVSKDLRLMMLSFRTSSEFLVLIKDFLFSSEPMLLKSILCMMSSGSTGLRDALLNFFSLSIDIADGFSFFIEKWTLDWYDITDFLLSGILK